MPVGRTEDDGRPFRTYRGKPQPMGALTEWTCPSCSQKVSGVVYEAGCPHCGVGVPGNEPQPQPEPVAAPQAQPQPVRAPGMASRPDVARRPVEAPALVVTRIVQYICKPGHEEQLEQILQRALVGHRRFDWGSITAAIVDDQSVRQQDILGWASRQPGVWLGGPEAKQRGPSIEEIIRQINPPLVRYGEDPGREEPHPLQQVFRGERMTEPIVPETGPSFSRMDQEMAKVLVQACGIKTAYTLALALQVFANTDDGDPLVLNREACYALANAIMQLIPRDYVEPDLPPPPPPSDAGVGTQEREDARARVRAIQEASKPVATVPE